MLFFSYFGTYHLNIHMVIHILSIFCWSPMPHNGQGIILVVVSFTISSNLTLDKGLNLTVFNAFSSKRYSSNILSNIHPSVLLRFIIILLPCFIFLGNCYEHTLQYTYYFGYCLFSPLESKFHGDKSFVLFISVSQDQSVGEAQKVIIICFLLCKN